MSDQFFAQPILNSPYDYPTRHWQLDPDGQPTGNINDFRRGAKFITPVPKLRKRRSNRRQNEYEQVEMQFGIEGIADTDQQYDTTSMVNAIRKQVDDWRRIPDPAKWRVTPETARLLQHWRHHQFLGIRPFFCQIEAVETAIWLTEVAPSIGKDVKQLLEHIDNANAGSNPELNRIALKLATGAGKTMSWP